MWNREYDNDDSTTLAGFMKRIQLPTEEPEEEDDELHLNSVPVLVKQIADCSDKETCEVFAARNVTVVGSLVKREIQSTRVIFTINDDTGTIRAIWKPKNSEDGNSDLPPIEIGQDVQAIGPLKNQNDERFLIIVKISRMTKVNGVPNHILDCLGVKMLAMLTKDFEEDARNGNVFAQDGCGGDDMPTTGRRLNSIQRKVFDLMKAETNTKTGISLVRIQEAFDTSEQEDVEDAIQFLIDKAYAYSTIDEHHYKIDAALLAQDDV